MIKSQLLKDIFDIIFDDIENEKNLRCQIPFLCESNIEHTGSGLFINFSAAKEIENYKLSTESTQNKDVDKKTTERISGVELRNGKLKIVADVSVYITDGLIDCVEIWNKNGEEYPSIEPTQYELLQVWVDSKKRKLTRN